MNLHSFRSAALSLAICLAILWHVAAEAQGTHLAKLRGEGWTVVEKRDSQERLPGLPPYENLIRVVQTTTFVLERDGTVITCAMSYDSQLDKISEECRPGNHLK